MDIISLPLLSWDTVLRYAYDVMKLHQKSAVVRQDDRGFELIEASDVVFGLADNVARLADIPAASQVYKITSNDAGQWGLNINHAFATRELYEKFLDSLGMSYGLLKAEQDMALVVTRSESLARNINMAPKTCYCTGRRRHQFPPPARSTNDTCDCGATIKCVQ